MTDYPTPKPGETRHFYCEAQQDYYPPEARLRRFTGQPVAVLAELPRQDQDSSLMFQVRAADGTVFEAHEEELNGWDHDRGQFFWSDGTYGHQHDRTFLINETRRDR